MTIVLFSAMRNREKILGLNEEIVRRNENLSSSPHSSYTDLEDQEQRVKALTGIEIEDEPEFEFYEEDNIQGGGLIVK